MGSRSNIRRARPADLDALCGIEQACFGASGDAFSRRQMAYLLTKASGSCFVAEADGRVVGYISLLTRRTACNLRIYSVAVDPAARGCGAGQALVEEAVAEARRRDLREVTLEVNVSNAAALALYRKNGFTTSARIPGYYHDGGDAWQMRREVSGHI